LTNKYVLPLLPFDENALEPFMSREQISIHYGKHHQAYVDGANRLLDRLDNERKADADTDVKALLKELSFNIGGHILHSLFWYNLISPKEAGKPEGVLLKFLNEEFGNLERFKKEFTKAAMSVEGSGWAALTFCTQTRRPIIMQIEKHSNNLYPTFGIIMVLDVFEHAYYLDYKNDRSKFIEAFWNVVNWKEVEKRLEDILRTEAFDSKSKQLIAEHLRNHIAYPAMRTNIVNAFSSMAGFSKEQMRWLEANLPEGKYNNAKEVIEAIGL
jgi:superoxide dismutase, Fe-Mn family